MIVASLATAAIADSQAVGTSSRRGGEGREMVRGKGGCENYAAVIRRYVGGGSSFFFFVEVLIFAIGRWR